MRPGVKGTVTLWPAFFAACSTPAQPAEDDQVGERDLLAAGRRLVELALDALQGLEHLRQLRGLVRFPVLLRREANAGAVRAAALVRAAEGGRRRPGRRNQLRDGQARSQDLGLERGDVLVVDQLVVDRGDRVLPDQLFLRDLRAEVARARAHVAVRQLEPGAGERVRELVRVLHEAARDLLVGRVEAQREVGGQHRRRRCASTCRAHRAPCPRPRRSSASTDARRPGSSSAPSRS